MAMSPGIPNRIDDLAIVQRVAEKARDNAFSDTSLDLRRCWIVKKNVEFMQAYGFTLMDIRNALSGLRTGDYCMTVPEAGKPDAYVFGPCLDGIDVYLKIQVENDVVVISFHDPDRVLSFPYREGRR